MPRTETRSHVTHKPRKLRQLLGISDVLGRIPLQLFDLDLIGQISTRLEHADTIQRVSPSSQEPVSKGQVAADECPYDEKSAWQGRRDNVRDKYISKAVASDVPITMTSTLVLRSSKIITLWTIIHQLDRCGPVCPRQRRVQLLSLKQCWPYHGEHDAVA
jgi:hypothetical protein